MTDAAPGRTPAVNRRDMALLVQLRWIAIAGQLVTIAIVFWALGIGLPLGDMLAAPLLLLLVNIATLALLRRPAGFSNGAMALAVMIDVGALGWQLYHSGGAANPFAFLFLLQIVIGAVILDPRWSWTVALAACLSMLLLTFHRQPLLLPYPYAADPFGLYLLGSLVCFLMIATLLVFFVLRMDRNRRESDAALAALRQQAIEEDHIVRMGLLASGAAHELGTPLSSLSVILGDWTRMPEVLANPDLAQDVQEIQSELARCKAIVSGILMSAGEIRGENPEVMPIRAFLEEIIAEWRARMPGELRFEDRLRRDLLIVADPALKQVIGNVIDNAVEVSPALLELRAVEDDGALLLEVRDHGPGFAPAMLERVGRPYNSTKGRPGGGLGLFLVVNVLRKLGGAVEVANLADGGARVRLRIPLASLAYRDDDSAS